MKILQWIWQGLKKLWPVAEWCVVKPVRYVLKRMKAERVQ